MDFGFISPAGGLAYHYRALRYSRRHWQPFRQEVASWLNGWEVSFDEILLVGPSSGYTLPAEWLKKFKRRVGIEPDPVARSIFEKRIGPTDWIKLKWFQVEKSAGSGDGFEFPLDNLHEWCLQHPQTPILFCNILGQLPLLHRKAIASSEGTFNKWKRDFAAVLDSQPFASFHDIYSSSTDFELSSFVGSLENSLASPVVSSLVASLSSPGVSSSTPSLTLPLPPELPSLLWPANAEVIDHLTQDVFAGHPAYYFKWTLTPRHHHLIQAVHS